MFNKIPNKIIVSTIVVAMFVVVTIPVKTSAQTTQENYNPQTVEEMIAYLYGMIAQLQAMLDAQNSQIGVAQPSNNKSDVEVTTLSADDIEEDEADLRGKVDLNKEDYAYVWFEYGEDEDDLDEKTGKTKLYDNSGNIRSFVSNIHNLDEDERYYFRAVAEDPDGDRDYGSIKYFTTDDDCCGSSSSDDYEIYVDDYTISEGDTVEVSWEIPKDDIGSQNWIGLYEEGDSNSDYITYEYLDKDDEGSVDFEIEDRGDYEFRLFLDNNYTDVAESRVVEVD